MCIVTIRNPVFQCDNLTREDNKKQPNKHIFYVYNVYNTFNEAK